jgi:hypothetical protein
MKELYYIGLDVHKKHVSYVIKTGTGRLIGSGEVEARREALSQWAGSIERPWMAALEAMSPIGRPGHASISTLSADVLLTILRKPRFQVSLSNYRY